MDYPRRRLPEDGGVFLLALIAILLYYQIY